MTSETQPSVSRMEAGTPVLVWDLPVRLTHWLTVVLVMGSWITAENHWLDWHRFCGYVILTLVLFRILWGFCGSTAARFSQFLCSPEAVVRYVCALRGRERLIYFGHNPLGGWSVVAMLSVLLLQAGLGLFAVDINGLESGPLAPQVSFEIGRQIANLHATVFNFVLLLIALHMAAILIHLVFKRENLILPMLTGRKWVLHEATPATYWSAPLWRALLGVALAALLVMGLITNF